MDADAVAEWNHSWAGVEADIWITLGIEPVTADRDGVVMKMPFKPEIGQATGVFSAGALVQLADVAATWLCALRLRDSGAPDGTIPLPPVSSASSCSFPSPRTAAAAIDSRRCATVATDI